MLTRLLAANDKDTGARLDLGDVLFMMGDRDGARQQSVTGLEQESHYGQGSFPARERYLRGLQDRLAHRHAKRPLPSFKPDEVKRFHARRRLDLQGAFHLGAGYEEGSGATDAVAAHLGLAPVGIEEPHARLVSLILRWHHHKESVRPHSGVPFADRAGELRQTARKATGFRDNEIVGQSMELAEGDFNGVCHFRRSPEACETLLTEKAARSSEIQLARRR
jgi:hypothetical protein